MSFLRAKKVKGKSYFYLVENVRVDAQVRQRILHYYGDNRPQVKEVLLRRLIIILERELTRREVELILKRQKPVKGRHGKGKKMQDLTMEITWAGGKAVLKESMGRRYLLAILKLLLHCP